ncbi:MAG: DUF429 domain-containing protein [Cyanobacteria bacterium SBLK]|nr:DUF429 domain-containing protein [Cyanobacteria bacterium SBLK]
MRFLGIDLGWQSGASGLSCLEWQDRELVVLDCQRQESIEEIFAWVEEWSGDRPALVAVDAPTLIPNATGTRVPDRLTHKYFGRYHAGCYPANLGLPFAERTVRFGLGLEERGFQHAPKILPKSLGRYQIEVFPHPAIVHLFGLERILKYKKGRLSDRKQELQKLHNYMQRGLSNLEPSLISCIPWPDNFAQFKTREFKDLEDRLDSIICAYVGAHWWYWGNEKNLVLGDKTTGYIVVPNPDHISD